ncbi:MAG TPA: SUMF1/EgtB/PvdO family nonheme iron enzyme [Accumulibacter sp.]|uniref:SUMF1/EgtB/PvdO family nonheme iron enzyme n=1 Tax=Accumulibacter sp. TaxID=2053492 RepID=UPI002C5054B9|nr:SUMF1/EgtB/PvdO family nonheme iron enzyme [Accumulibacter sp.]HMW82045.1 SUMF1/EgtB/PvdO family nonheme iron enzyme [Accumulibacter sp.]
MNTIVPLVGPQAFRRLLTLGVLLASLPVRALDAGAPGLLPAPAQPQVVPDRAAAERAKHAEEALKRSEAEKQRLAAEKQRLAAEKQRLENALAESERRPPRVVEKLVEKPVPDSGAAKRAAQSEREAQQLRKELAQLRKELAEARANAAPPPGPTPAASTAPATPKAVVGPAQSAPAAKSAPVAAGDAAAACWRDGAWLSGCGFAAYAGGPTMRVVGGDLRYRMGSPESEKDRVADEGPQHEVAFARRFALAETETTVAQYLACVEEKACDEPEWRQAGSKYHYQTGTDTYYRDKDAHLSDRPISGVSWHNAQQYVRWLSGKGQGKYELPSEAMWEYAARGGSPGRWYFGDDESRLAEHAWYGNNAGGKLHAVGTTQRKEHPWGLRDMHGNVWEWVADCWHDNYNGAPGDGRVWEGGDCGRRVLRGGSWNNNAGDARSALRYRNAPDYRFNSAGFRPSRMLP